MTKELSFPRALFDFLSKPTFPISLKCHGAGPVNKMREFRIRHVKEKHQNGYQMHVIEQLGQYGNIDYSCHLGDQTGDPHRHNLDNQKPVVKCG